MSNDLNDVERVTERVQTIFKATEEVLGDWKGEGCLQFKILFKMISLKLGTDDDQMKMYDPLIRFFITNHTQYSSQRGARGGVIRLEDKLRIEQAKKEKEERRQKELETRVELLKLVNERTEAAITLTPEDMGE